jgi:hypothetical protein
MNPTLKKAIAVLMIIITAIGMLFSIFFLVLTWRIRQPATQKLQTAFEGTSAVLQTTIVGLDVIDQVVTNVYSSTIYISDATDALAKTIENTDQFVETAGSFMGNGFTTTISNTQRTLESAQSSALVIDNILTTLSRVPLIGINYNPATPLSTALGEVSSSLDPLQESLKGFQENLVSTQSNLQVFVTQLDLLKTNITEINKNLADSMVVIETYKSQVTDLKAWFDKAVLSLPAWITTFCIFITIFILLLIFVQGAIMLQGIYLLKSPVLELNQTVIPMESPMLLEADKQKEPDEAKHTGSE